MKKKILFSLIVFILVFAVGVVVKTNAGTGDNTSGWLWGGGAEIDGVSPWDGINTNVGWISMNSTNCDNNPTDGTIDDPDCIAAGASGSSVNYGVNIPSTDGDFTGPGYYAWSENIGYISFNPSDLIGCPVGVCTARRVTTPTDHLEGWARIVDIKTELEKATPNSGGWEGWISLWDQTGSDNYGVGINSNGTLSGYAWSDELGWIDFSRASTTSNPMLIICPDSFPSLIVGNNLSLSAYYIANGSINCSNTTGATDVTSDPGTNWSSDDSNVVSVDNGSQKGRVTGVSVGGPVNINAAYSSLVNSAPITVVPVPAICGDGSLDAGEECDDGVNNGVCPALCSASCTLNNCSDANWREVAP